jgi:hypothetical protein
MNNRAYHYNEMDYKTFYNLVNNGDMIMWDNGDIDYIRKDAIFAKDKWLPAPGVIVIESYDSDDATMIPLDAKFEIYKSSFIHVVQWENTSAFSLYKKAEIFDEAKDVNNEQRSPKGSE